MADTVIEQTQATEIDPAKFLQERNERERNRREGKDVPRPAEAATATTTEPPREKRRSGVSRLHREIGELRGRLAAFEEMGRKAPEKEVKAEPKTAPDRADFATDEEFEKANRAHEIRTEAGKLLDEKKSEEADNTEFRETLSAISTQLQKATEEFPDWDKVITEGNKTPLPGNMPEYSPVLFIAMSKNAASKNPVYNDLVYHFAQHPAELVDLMKRENSAAGLPKKQGDKIIAEVIEEFHQLCGELRAEKKRRGASNAGTGKVETKEPAGATKVATQAERDAKKPPPSSSAEVRGGSSPNMERPDPSKDPAGYIRWRNEQEKGAGNIGRR